MLAADPLLVGAVYIEEDFGSDLHGDTFEVTFLDGATDTQLTRVVISGDQGPAGFGEGDVIFDTQAGGLGADSPFQFQVVSLTTRDPNATVTASVLDGSSVLQIDFTNFYAGDKLIFSIDVDEIEYFDPLETDPELIADGIDPITSGVEFQGSLFTASFAAPHYHNVSGQGEFRNRYDDQLVGTGLDLPLDDSGGQRDRTDGVVVTLQQQPLPISISGTVFLDNDLDLTQDSGEPGLQGVELGLWRRAGSQFVFTGHTTQTGFNGDYEFGFGLNLEPGVFQVRETQPSGLFSVGAISGTVAGEQTGVWDVDQPDWLSEIEIPLGGQRGVNFDFAEARPVEISGHVYHDRNNDGSRNAGEEGIEGVEIRLVPLDTIAQQSSVTLTTDSQGFYAAEGLAPGRYRVVEVVQPPGYFDGLDAAGRVAGITRGNAVNPGDSLENIFLLGGDAGIEYNFGELMPAAIEGRVHLSDPDGDCFSPGVVHPPLPDVTIRLLDAQGNFVAETRTASDGSYRFGDLLPGVYTILEVTPAGVIDGGERVGQIGGSTTGQVSGDDRLSGIVLGSGQTGLNYDFCEHAPASVSGHVYHDADNSGVFGPGEAAIAGVRVTLLDDSGNVVAQRDTDGDGFYEFLGLRAGQYTVRETQPTGWIDGQETVGRVDGRVVGTASNDEIRQLQLRWGDAGTGYDFGELMPVEISGFVYHDRSNDGLRDPGEEGLAGVAVQVIPVNPLAPQDTVTVLTDANGRYFADGLAPGSYRIVEAQQPSEFFDGLDTPGTVGGQQRGSVSNPGDSLEEVFLASGEAGVEYNFGELAPAWIRGHVRLSDPHGDCFTTGAVGIGDVVIVLLNERGEQVAETRTAADGEYSFSGLLPGSYTVVEQTPAGLLDGGAHVGHVDGETTGVLAGDDTIRNIIVGSGQEGFDYDFCEHAPASVSGHVYHDADNNGEFDNGETPIAGVTIALLDESGNLVATQDTDARGFYEFAGLPAGLYTVRETQPAGWIDGQDTAGTIAGTTVGLVSNDQIRQLQLRFGDEGMDYDFGELLPVEISGFVYHDRSNDGVRDPGEEGLAGVTLQVIPVNPLSPQDAVTVITDATGHYLADNLAPGAYRVVELQQPTGFFDGLDTAGMVAGQQRGSASNPGDSLESIFLASGEAGVEYNFGELAPTGIRGHVRLSDREGNCFTPGANGIQDVEILLLNERGEQIAQTRTDAAGAYSFSDLSPGTYTVVERTPAGLIDGEEHIGTINGVSVGQLGANDTIRNIVLGSSQRALDYDFCEHAPASVSGFVYHDIDHSGVFNLGETPIAGVTITLLDSSGNLVAQQQTDGRGFYEFTGLGTGNYTLRQTQPTGWIDGRDSAGRVAGNVVGTVGNDEVRQIELGWGDEGSHYDFGELLPVELSGFVYHDRNDDGLRDPGEEGLAGVAVQVIPVNPLAPQDAVTVLTDADGRYFVAGLAPGSYRIVEGQQPAGFFDGLDTPGTVDGQQRGSVSNPGDSLEEVFLASGETGVEYNFGELSPAWVRGHVRLSDPNGECFSAGAVGLADVVILLFNDRGEQVAETRTDDQGEYNFSGLLPGSYTVVERTPAGLIDGPEHTGHVDGNTVGQLAENDTIRNIIIGSGQEGFDYDFCEHAPASLSGHVYHDADNSGSFSSGEAPIAGVTVTLFDESGNLVAEQDTDAQGFYQFVGLRAGVYTLRESQPIGWIDGSDTAGQIGGARIGTVANDEIAGVRLRFGDQGTDFDFGELLPAEISGFVYHDRDDDGRRDPGEEGLEGVTIQVIPLDPQTPQDPVTVTTDVDGRYFVEGLAPGNYRVVQQDQPLGFFDGLDTPGTVGGQQRGSVSNPGDSLEGIFLASGEVGVEYNFGELSPTWIRGHVRLTDPDGNCSGPGAEDRGIAGVVVLLLNDRGEQIAETRTNANGEYNFSGLLPGSYTVVEQTPAGLIDGPEHIGHVDGVRSGELAGNDTIRNIVLEAGQEGFEFDFCEHEPAELSGHVYHDRNDNGQRDFGEEAIPGVQVELRDSSGQLVRATDTDRDGQYSFSGLDAGVYSIVERQPSAWLDGQDTVGVVAAAPMGRVINPGDEMHDVALGWGQVGTEYDFGELQPGSIGGLVHADGNGNCELDPGEQVIAGVTIRLLDKDGVVVATTTTDAAGRYEFTGLAPGEYSVWESQPVGVLQGGQRSDVVGSHTGEPDLIANIQLGSGEQLLNNNFCEALPASIAGTVHLDPDGDCQLDPGEAGLQGVTVQLLNAEGDVVATTQTDSQGHYRFEGLTAGRYTVRELQPAGYFHGGQRVGAGGGVVSANDLLALDLGSGQALVGNNFCELPSSSLSGFVFQDGPTLLTRDGAPPADLEQLRDGQQTSDDVPIAGVVLELRDGLSGEAIMAHEALPGYYASGPIRTTTNAAGFYEFLGIPGQRSYAVYEIQPDGFIDGIDTPGTTSGLAINPSQTVPEFILNRLVENPKNDAIVLIPLGLGQSSQLNNFSEIRIESEGPTPVPPSVPTVPLPPANIAPLIESPAVVTTTTPVVATAYQPLLGGGGRDYSWHLSVINAGAPRETDLSDDINVGSWYVAEYVDAVQWRSEALRDANWIVVDDDEHDEEQLRTYVFGLPGGIPVVGDFNGDGFDEIGIYFAGEWYIDLNGDGRWDERDVWAKLGDEHDLPVTGDWDADGKDDIGIFGPQWQRDPAAIEREPGLPDAANSQQSRVKNLPPQPEEATDGFRLLQRQADGRRRADVIDHVFRFGSARDIPIAGDWNGDGIRTIGVFREGQWRLDQNGDGRSDDHDSAVTFGQTGDLPVVGDFNGDGVEEIGVYRNGTWYIDMNRNFELDAHDKVFEMGGAGDTPVSGDWDGDGVDEPGLYQSGATENTAQRE